MEGPEEYNFRLVKGRWVAERILMETNPCVKVVVQIVDGDKSSDEYHVWTEACSSQTSADWKPDSNVKFTVFNFGEARKIVHALCKARGLFKVH